MAEPRWADSSRIDQAAEDMLGCLQKYKTRVVGKAMGDWEAKRGRISMEYVHTVAEGCFVFMP
jgi:hypothetical protein